MTLPTEISGAEKRVARLQEATDPFEVRQGIIELGHVLGPRTADIVHGELGPLDDVLCVVVLRGGALMYPGFAAAFPHADFCMVGMRRSPDGNSVAHEYLTDIPRDSYQATIYIDCVAATGGTLLAVGALVSARCHTGPELAAVINSASAATERLHLAGIDLLGFSLYEELYGPVVTPDMGRLDAGDLFSGGAGRSGADGPNSDA
ncbi:uracil phosphoribosyltransferase [Streptomyces sp. NPDC059256]|uniref:uracil phosphoribosyltransferase n=1 Tax=Streptomyces sp. NPDC059256 TaxID=3346794 RepID=UPI00369ADDBC